MKKILILLIAVFTATTTFAQRNHRCKDNYQGGTDCSGSITVSPTQPKKGDTVTASGGTPGTAQTCSECGKSDPNDKHSINITPKSETAVCQKPITFTANCDKCGQVATKTVTPKHDFKNVPGKNIVIPCSGTVSITGPSEVDLKSGNTAQITISWTKDKSKTYYYCGCGANSP
ncbi:hypothetical protein, partial [Candidatus Albibeggiatoa sp. nov. NOAA]|uniref:hypothetical protein n=1 Tax=Candidatus Albibeggiatoa sp. nov. NOAA TaxID=3162724 RepID=UPI0032FB02FF|nr:hypothetical protein [Thiotrichaceae bacterium]